MSPDVPTFKVRVLTSDFNWSKLNIVVANIVSLILLTLFTSIALPILRIISICGRWVFFGVSYVLFKLSIYTLKTDHACKAIC